MAAAGAAPNDIQLQPNRGAKMSWPRRSAPVEQRVVGVEQIGQLRVDVGDARGRQLGALHSESRVRSPAWSRLSSSSAEATEVSYAPMVTAVVCPDGYGKSVENDSPRGVLTDSGSAG
jgi:hypothetical protein